MSVPREKDDATPGAGITIAPIRDDVSQEELNVHIEQNRLEAQKRRNHSQLETANKLHALTLQQQEQIRKLQEHVSYNQLRETFSPCKLAPLKNHPNNVKKHNSSVYVSTFNPPHDNDSCIKTIKPNSVNKFANPADCNMPSTPDSHTTIPKAALVPLLHSQQDALSGESILSPSRSEVINMTNDSSHEPSKKRQGESIPSPSRPEVIDMTNDSIHEPSKKRHKGTTVKVTVIVNMPEHAGPSVKTMQLISEVTGSDDDSAE
jgi:hypothetical protein